MAQFYVVTNKTRSPRHIILTIAAFAMEDPETFARIDGPMSMHNASLCLSRLQEGDEPTPVPALPLVGDSGESLSDDQRLIKDLTDSVAVQIGLWEERNKELLALYNNYGKQSLIDEALYDLTSVIEDENEDEEDEDDEPREPIGEEAFENSYIGNGGAPDPDNM